MSVCRERCAFSQIMLEAIRSRLLYFIMTVGLHDRLVKSSTTTL